MSGAVYPSLGLAATRATRSSKFRRLEDLLKEYPRVYENFLGRIVAGIFDERSLR